MEQNFDVNEFDVLFQKQREYFFSGATKDIAFRKNQLTKLRNALKAYEKELMEALEKDLHKCNEEAYLTEFGVTYHEISFHIRRIDKWTKAKRVKTPFTLFPASSKIISEPMGTSLIIAPWNYPVQLLLMPLIGAISAGCTAILKPSPYTKNVSSVLKTMIENTFCKEYIALLEGHRDVNTALLELPFDVIFFTGSPSLGRIVMQKAAKNLSRVILELGGKSPCIVDEDANLSIAAKRIAWGKILNAGQTCVAPDYILLHKNIRQNFISALKDSFTELLGENPQQAPYLTHVIHKGAMERLKGYLHDGDVIYGGNWKEEDNFFYPTLLENPKADSPVMTEEIFGPVLPIMEFDDIETLIKGLNEKPKPLALYYFGKKNADTILRRTFSGGVSINDTIMHVASPTLPFGGVGNSGTGRYHGKESFLCFSHQKSILCNSTLFDIPLRYMPYKFSKIIKHFLR
ncbi:MAG: aldehyde dehydrogenase [Alistipes sp.]|nr:aldehyde dehydrogenase [Candidatus Alistipes equi]